MSGFKPKGGFPAGKIVASSCRQKIIKILFQKKEIGIMKLINLANGTYNEINRNILILERHGIIVERRQKRQRLLSLNLKNAKTSKLIEIIKIIDHIEHSTE